MCRKKEKGDPSLFIMKVTFCVCVYVKGSPEKLCLRAALNVIIAFGGVKPNCSGIVSRTRNTEESIRINFKLLLND